MQPIILFKNKSGTLFNGEMSYRRKADMHGRWNTDMSKYSKVIEFGTKANADRYVAAGWELIETRAEPFILGKTIIVYRVGWPDGAGGPVMPPTDDDLRGLKEGPSAN